MIHQDHSKRFLKINTRKQRSEKKILSPSPLVGILWVVEVLTPPLPPLPPPPLSKPIHLP
jgi:hypothetical protein